MSETAALPDWQPAARRPQTVPALSAAALKRRTSAAGSVAEKMADPATSVVAPRRASGRQCSSLTPPSTYTSSGRSPTRFFRSTSFA